MTRERLAFALLVVGLIVGAGAGYAAASLNDDDDSGAHANPAAVTREKTIARRIFLDGLNHHDWALFSRYHAPGFVDFDTPPGFPQGLPGAKKVEGALHHAMPDAQFTIRYILGQRDVVAVRWTACGTFTKTFHPPFGFHALKPNGRTVRWTGSRWFHFVHGKIVATWANIDLLGLLTQTGAFGPVRFPEPICPKQSSIEPVGVAG